MTRVVLDTNVLAVANEMTPEADEDCVRAAANSLREAIRKNVIVIDTQKIAINEYSNYANWEGQPRVGDLFFKVLTDNIANPDRVCRVDIGSTQDEIDICVPEQLLDFDRNDRKWIALYLEGSAESIINAVDSDWAARKADLDGAGIAVIESVRNA